MQENVFKEYRNTIHYQNRTGVRATCPDCHVPKDWTHKIVRKIQASNELWHHMLGSVDTPEKFNAKRIRLAQSEWARMKGTDSRECRNCHHYDYMDYAEQGRRASAQHQKGFGEGKTCIDCHKGIAHTLPPIEQNIGAPKLSAGRSRARRRNAGGQAGILSGIRTARENPRGGRPPSPGRGRSPPRRRARRRADLLGGPGRFEAHRTEAVARDRLVGAAASCSSRDAIATVQIPLCRRIRRAGTPQRPTTPKPS